MRLIRREFEVDVPLEEAWRHLSRVTAWPSWAQHIRSIKLEPPGELRLGSKGRIRLRNGVRSDFEVTEMKPGSHWLWVGPFLWLTVRYDHQFEALGPRRTKLIWIVDAEGTAASLFGRLFAAVYRRSMERAIPRLVEEMKHTHLSMPSEATNQATRTEWRDLGFHYDCHEETKAWRLTGSRSGLLRFRDLLLDYVRDPRNETLSEHEHYGPYMYLEVMTWTEPGFDDHCLRGTLLDLERLAGIVESKLSAATAGSILRIHSEFAKDSPYALILDVRADGFDPATADPRL